MISAFLLLSGFVSFWLVQRYKQEKEDLKGQLEYGMAETQRQVVDSLLFKTIVRPLFADSTIQEDYIKRRDEEREVVTQVKNMSSMTFTRTSPDSLMELEQQHEADAARNEAELEKLKELGLDKIPQLAAFKGMGNLKVTVKVNSDSTPTLRHQTISVFSEDHNAAMGPDGQIDAEKRNKRQTISMRGDTSSVYLLQGMKLILGEMAGNTNPRMKVTSDFSVSADTGLLKMVFQEKMSAQKVALPYTWVVAKKDSLKAVPGHLKLKTNMFSSNYEVDVAGVNWYLIRKLTSQICFVLLMLGITALAFILAYRSLLRQERLNQMKNDLINNMSHELKTPVATVKVALEALGDSRVMQNERMASDYIGMATLEVNRLELLLGKVLNTSLLDSKHAFINKEALNMNELVEDSVTAMKMKAEKQGAILKADLPELPLIIPADKIHVQGVILNLIDNALKYAGSQPKVEVWLGKDHNQVVVQIKDNGPGIPEEYIGKVFDKFFRVPSGNVHDTKGYGLGLSYAQQVMTHHGGSISVKNIPGGGCSFELRFKA